MTNFYPVNPDFSDSMLSSPSSDSMSSTPNTPSPPIIYYPPDLLRHNYMPLPYHLQQPIKTYNTQQERNHQCRPKRAFTIDAILGLDENKDLVGRERVRPSPYGTVVPTPRSALRSLLLSTPESSPKKDDSKCHLSSPNDDTDQESKFGILHQGSCNSPSKSSSGKMKRIRTLYTPEQLERLESEFERQQYMVGPERQDLATALHLTNSQVKIWFQNRRIKWRKQVLVPAQEDLNTASDNCAPSIREPGQDLVTGQEDLNTASDNGAPSLREPGQDLVPEQEDLNTASDNCAPSIREPGQDLVPEQED